MAEVIREQIFHFTHQEVPYATAVRVEELTERTAPERLYIRATIFVEQESQKGIVIGKGGAMLKRVGTAARRELEALLRHSRCSSRTGCRCDTTGARTSARCVSSGSG